MRAELELCWGTVMQAGFAELVEAAGAAGFQAVTMNPDQVLAPAFSAGEVRARLVDAGVRVSNLDALVSVLPGLPSAEFIASYGAYGTGVDIRRGFELTEDEFYRAAELTGAESINLVHFLCDPATPLEAIAEAAGGVARRAAAHGLRTVFEFLPGTGVPDIHAAARLVRMVDDPNLAMMLDTRHLARAGGTAEDVARYADLVGATQVSDLRWATRDQANRLLPGEGDLALEAMMAPVRTAAPQVAVGIEVFSTELFALPAREAAQRAAKTLRDLVERIEAVAQGGDGR